MAQKQIFSLLLVGCLAALALANPLPEEHPAVPAPTGPATDPLYQNLAFKNAKLEGKKEKRSAEEATKTGGSLPTPVAPKVVAQNQEGKKEKLENEGHRADNVTKAFEELVSLLANPFSANLTGTTGAPSAKPKREAEEVKPKTEGVKVGSTQPIAPKPVTETKKEKRDSDPEAAELVKAELICDRESETSASSQDDPSTVDEVYDVAAGCQEQLRELKGETPRVESHSDEPASTEEKKEKKSVEEDGTDAPDCSEGDGKNKRSVEEETPRLASKDVPNEKKEKRSAEEKPVVATKPAPKEEEHKDKRSAEEKKKEPVVATKPAPKEEEHKEKRNAEEKPVVATKPAPKEEEHKEKRSAEEKKKEPVVATKPAPKEEEHKEKRSAEEKPVVASKPAPKEEEHKDKRSAEEKPVVATKPASKEEEHKEKRNAEEKPKIGTQEVKVPQEKRERRGVYDEKPVLAKDIPVPREESKKDKRSTVESKANEGATLKDEPHQSGPYPIPSTQEGGKKEKRYVDQVRAEKQTVPALKQQEPGELEKKVERRSAESTSVIKGAAFEDKPWEVKPYVTAPPTKLPAKE